MSKTIRLQSTYNGLPPGSIITVSDAIAAGLTAGNIGATYDLSGGTRRYVEGDSGAPEQTVGAQTRVTIAVPAGRALTISGGVQAAGLVETLNSVGAVVSSQSARSGDIGPLQGGKSYRLSVDYGSFQTSLVDVDLAYDPAPRFSVPVAMATWGDSLTDTCSATVQDISVATLATHQNADLWANRLASALLFYSGGKVVPVINCGVGGTNSTQILARDSAAVGPNRRGATDASNSGAKVCVLSLGVNDIIQNVVASTTPAAITTILNTIYANTAAAVRRVQRLGMHPMLRELPGYGYEDSTVNYAKIANKSPADVAAAVAVIQTAADYIANTLVPTLGDVTLLKLRERCVDPKTGDWLPGYSVDKLHESANGVREIAKLIIDATMRMTRPYTATGPYAPLPSASTSQNGFAAPAMVTVASNLASGFKSFASGIGATTRTPAVTTDADGTVWQEWVINATSFNGSARLLAPQGLAASTLTFDLATFGANATLALASGDPVRVEFDLVIDDGAGGTPVNVLSWGVDVNLGYPTSSFFTTKPMEKNISDGALQVPLAPIMGKVISMPMAAPDTTANMNGGFVNVVVYASTTATHRVRLANPRVVKFNWPR